MEILLEIIFLLVGFVLLIKGADYFVEGSSAVAKKLKVPSIVIGLTIVAIGTSMPELAVSTFASAQNSNDIALSNVIGSNIFNLLVVLGFSALFHQIRVKSSIVKREFPFLLVVTIITILLAGDRVWSGKITNLSQIFTFQHGSNPIGVVGRLDGILFVLLFVGFLWWTVRYALKERQKNQEENEEQLLSAQKCVLFILGGIIAIVAGGEVVVYCAKKLALAAGMSEVLVGLTVVALGTSLPELVTSAVAAKKGEADIAVGNVVGSNIANILLVLGMSATISPVGVVSMSLVDTIVSLVATLLVWGVAGNDKKIKRPEGILLLLVYFAYMAYIICRQYL